MPYPHNECEKLRVYLRAIPRGLQRNEWKLSAAIYRNRFVSGSHNFDCNTNTSGLPTAVGVHPLQQSSTVNPVFIASGMLKQLQPEESWQSGKTVGFDVMFGKAMLAAKGQTPYD